MILNIGVSSGDVIGGLAWLSVIVLGWLFVRQIRVIEENAKRISALETWREVERVRIQEREKSYSVTANSTLSELSRKLDELSSALKGI